MSQRPIAANFPVHSVEKTRFGDTDAYGHINNAVISSYLETGRGDLLRADGESLAAADCQFVLASVTIDFCAELYWPGTVLVASRVTVIGRTSLGFEQAVFQNDICCVQSTSTLVHVNAKEKKSAPLTNAARSHFDILR